MLSLGFYKRKLNTLMDELAMYEELRLTAETDETRAKAFELGKETLSQIVELRRNIEPILITINGVGSEANNILQVR